MNEFVPKQVMERDVQTLIEVLHQASSVKRYSRDFMFKEENLLEHVGFTVTFAYIIGLRLRNAGHHVSMSVLLESAVMHDFEEILTGDVTRRTKHSSKEVSEGLKKYEAHCMGILEASLKVSIFGIWKHAKDEKTLEGRIVKIADFAAVVYKSMVEVAMLGNKSFVRVSTEISEEMEVMLREVPQTDALYWVIKELASILKRSRNGDIEFGHFFKGV